MWSCRIEEALFVHKIIKESHYVLKFASFVQLETLALQRIEAQKDFEMN